VIVKVGIVLFVIVVGAFYVNPANWHPFAPHGYAGLSFFGHTIWGQENAAGKPLGMLAGAAISFIAYIGFDSAHACGGSPPIPGGTYPSASSARC